MNGRIFAHVKREDWRWNWNNKSMKYVTDIALEELHRRADEENLRIDMVSIVIVNRRTATFIAEMGGYKHGTKN